MTHAIHDFTGKLRQPSAAGQLQTYVNWRRAVADARARGEKEPAAPESSPISINLDLTTACNYRCTHCIDWDILNTKNKHQEAELRESIELMAKRGLRSVILIGGGEPTLYPGFPGFVKFLKDLDLQVSIVSNGSRGDRLLEAIQYMKAPDWIRLSLDSGSNDLFVAMHKPVNKKWNLDAVCEWVPQLKAKNPSVRLGFSYIIIWGGATREDNELHENIHEIKLAAERAKRSQFDYIAFKPVLERQEDGAEVMDPEKSERELSAVVRRIRQEVDAAKELADDGFDVYESTNLRLLEEGNWQESTRQPRTCHMQALRQVLTPTGLFNCPAHRGVEKARIGSRTAYRGEEEARATGDSLAGLLDRFDASHECREVTCLYHSANWWIEGLIENPEAEIELSDEREEYFL
ncbi:MAG: radical SAM protein [Myxococcales bacterium]|nr:radical SAM protein [Myxococcales bacterium]